MKKITHYYLFFFVVLIMIDPTDGILHVKTFAFVILMILTILSGMCNFSQKPAHTFTAIVIAASISVITGLIIGNLDINNSISYLRTLLFLLIFLPLSTLSIEQIQKINYLVGIILAVGIIIIYIFMLQGRIDFEIIYEMNQQNRDTILISNRSLLGYEGLMFFYKSMPFLIIPLAQAVRKKNILLSILLFIPILIGMSRTPVICAAFTVLYVLFQQFKSKSLKYILVFVSICCFVNLVQEMIFGESSSSGDVIKYRTATDLITQSLPLGYGVGVKYFSASRGEWVTNSEVTYFEMIYQYGWVLALYVMYKFIQPGVKLLNNKTSPELRDLGVAYLMYLVIAGTNPLLINSTGLYVFACVLVIWEKSSQNVKTEYDSNSFSNIQFRTIS